jgi:hypothetical protein
VYATSKKLLTLCSAMVPLFARFDRLACGADGTMRTDNVQSASAAQSARTLWSDRMLKNSSRVMNENDAAAPAVANDSAEPL